MLHLLFGGVLETETIEEMFGIAFVTQASIVATKKDVPHKLTLCGKVSTTRHARCSI